MGARGRLLLVLAISGASVFSSAGAQSVASATVESIQGEVQLGGAPIFQDQRISPRARVTTGRDSQVVLRFDDGRRVALGETTILAPGNGGALFHLLSGAVRVRTSDRGEVVLHTAHGQFRARGPADFTVVVSDVTYLDVREGSVIASNAGGEATFSPGSSAAARDARSGPAAAAPPEAVAAAMSELRALDLRGVARPGAEDPAAEAARAALAAPRPEKLWVGASLMRTSYDTGATSRLLSEGSTAATALGYRVFAGYKFHRSFGVEVGYADFGEFDYTGTFEGQPVRDGRAKVSGFDVGLVGWLPVGNRAALFGKVGAFAWESEASDRIGDDHFSATADGTDFMFGAGLRYALWPTVSLRAEFDSRQVAGGILAFSLGLEARF